MPQPSGIAVYTINREHGDDELKYRTSGEAALTPTEYNKLINACNTLKDEVMIKLAVSTGMRRADITTTKIKDIDFVNKTLSFYEHKKRRIKTVPLGPHLLRLLRQHIDTLDKSQKDILGFGSRQAYNRFQSLCERAGIPRRPFHALRATCIKRCQLKGWTPEQTAELVGDTLRVIDQHYKTPSVAEMHEAVNEREVV